MASCQKRVEELAEGLARLKRDNDASACVSFLSFSFPVDRSFFVFLFFIVKNVNDSVSSVNLSRRVAGPSLPHVSCPHRHWTV